jgi:hypothetical protein
MFCLYIEARRNFVCILVLHYICALIVMHFIHEFLSQEQRYNQTKVDITWKHSIGQVTLSMHFDIIVTYNHNYNIPSQGVDCHPHFTILQRPMS